MSRPPLESTVTNKIIKKLNALDGVYARKAFGGRFGAGWPDIVGCAQGRMLAIEVKRGDTGYKVTPLQERELGRWRDAGAISGVVTSWAQVVDLCLDGGITLETTG